MLFGPWVFGNVKLTYAKEDNGFTRHNFMVVFVLLCGKYKAFFSNI